MAELIAYVTNLGVPAPGLADDPEITVHRTDTGAAIVTAQAMTDIGLGFYRYTLAIVDGIEYAARVDADPNITGQVTAGERFQPLVASGVTDSRIEADIPAILVDTAAIDGRLPSDPADESIQLAAHTQTQADIAALNDLAAGAAMDLTAAAINSIWDEVNTGADHNVKNSTGKQLRQASGGFEAEDVVSATATTIELDAGESSIDDFLAKRRIAIVDGTGVGQLRVIQSYNGTTKIATLSRAWDTTPNASSDYLILGSTESTLTPAAIDTIWDELQAGHAISGSFGEFLDALITSRSSHSAADVDTTLTGAHGAGSWTSATSVGLTAAAIDAIWDELLAGHAISGSAGEALTAAASGGDPAAIADAVWDELQAGHLTASTFGAFLNAAITSLQTEASASARAATSQGEHDATQADIAALNDLSIADVQTALTNQGYTAARAPNLDNLDAAITTRESEASAATRAGTNQTEHDATQAAIAALNDPDTATIVTAILAGIIDGTVDLKEVLSRLNAIARGRIVKDVIDSLTIDVEYYEEDNTTISHENRKTTGARTPQ